MISIHYIAYFYYDSFFINVVSYIGHLYVTEYDDVPNSKSRPRGLENVTICWLSSNAPLSLCNIFVGPGFLCGISLFILCIYHDLNFKPPL